MNKLYGIAFFLIVVFAFFRPVFALPGDINGDGKVDITDVALVSKAFGSRPGSPRWDARCDTDLNGVIDITDVAFVSKLFGSK